MRDTVATDLIRVALSKAEGTPFELFCNDFFPAIAGGSYVPLGGYKDGGADAFEEPIHEREGGVETFYQASVERNAEAKIDRTISRLKQFGRDPRRLIFLTPHVLKHVDRLEDELTQKHDATITIRDGNYIAAHVNDDANTVRAFEDHLRHYTDFLKGVGASNLVSKSANVKNPAVYVFLSQELDRRRGDEGLVDSVTDTLALWALEGTDPDEGILRTADEVMQRIQAELPAVVKLVKKRMQRRLEHLARKDREDGRAVRWHRRENAFCLPHETRRLIEAENAQDEALRLDVLRLFEERASGLPHEGLGVVGLTDVANVALRALEITFEREGLEFAAFLQDSDREGEYVTISDSVRAALEALGFSGKRGQMLGQCAFGVLRETFYASTSLERDYLQRLSRTYALLFTLNTDPRLVRFFEEMAGTFYLYVGTDVIVKALSEHLLATGDQPTRNTLHLASKLGAELVLTGPALEEVVGHLRACDFEYRNHVEGREANLSMAEARSAPHILLRSYLYSQVAPSDRGGRQPRNWQAFINQFCSYAELHKPGAVDDVRRFLQNSFGMKFRDREALQELSTSEAVARLATALAEDKAQWQKPDVAHKVAENDALVALAVYGHRRKRQEHSAASEFGYETWWLTGETSIVRHTRDLVKRHCARYIMRPEFLLSFLALAPTAQEARESFANVFPSLLGIQLSKRMAPDAFHKLMDRVGAAEEMDDARRAAAIARISDELKGDLERVFLIT